MRYIVSPPRAAIAACALFLQALSSCSEQCPSGFRREGDSCEPVAAPRQREAPVEPEANG